jgi:putative peptide zinc metalloprotease protein
VAVLLHPIRQELRLAPGAPLVNGAPGFILFDPLRHRFFQLGELEQRILQLWPLGDPRAIRSHLIADGHDADRAEAAIATFLRFASAEGLLRDEGGDTVARLVEKRAAAQRSWWRWLVDNYLFIRVPLVRPGAFLRRTLPVAARIWSPTGIGLLCLAGIMGLFLATRQVDDFGDDLSALMTSGGLVAYLCALVFVKCLHEAGHAYMATRFGCRVPSMGINFLVMVPFLYTDTSAAWKLRSRRQRLLIDAAGVLAELSVAALALFLWSFLPEGPLRTAAFILATVSLATSLLINASPFMRFDGYYLLSDALGVANLAPRAFAMMRWWLRETLFDLREPPPESLSTGHRRGLIVYAIAALLYRTVLYIGIALLVYHMFFKALGIALFILEVIVFLIRPFADEMRQWWARRQAIAVSRRARWLATGLGLALVALFLPLDRSVSLPAVLAPMGDQAVVAGEAARVERILVRNGQAVRAGEPLIELSSPELDLGEAQARLRIAQLESQLARGVADQEDLANTTMLQQSLAAERDRLAGYARRRLALAPRAEIGGRVVDLPRDLVPGAWTNGRTALLRVVTDDRYDVRAYAPETAGWRLIPGTVGRFIPNDAMAASWRVRLDEAGSVAVSRLGDPLLASTNGGPIAVVPDPADRAVAPKDPMLVLHLVAERRAGTGILQPMAGRVVVPARGDSVAAAIWRSIGRIMVRETSLQ